MRPTNFAALTLTTLALAACGGEAPPPQPPPAPPPPPTASATPPPADTAPPPPPKPSLGELIPQTIKGVGDAFNAHDSKKVASYYTDDAVVVGYGEPEMHGRDENAKMVQMVMDLVGDQKSAVTRVWTKGNVAITEIAWAGTMTGDFMGTKASKKPIGQMRLHIMWFNDDGLIKEEHEYADAMGMMQQMKGAKGAPPVPTVPTSPPEMHIAKGTPDEDKLADWGKGIDDTFSKDDVKAVTGSMLADDSDYWMNITGKPATKGKKDLTKELTDFFKAFPDQKWSTTNAWGIDGYAIVEHTMTGTQKGQFGPLAPSNKQVQGWHFVDIVQPTADGKQAHGWAYANLLEMMVQTGAFKPQPKEGAKGEASKTDSAKAGATKAPKTDTLKSDKDAPKKK